MTRMGKLMKLEAQSIEKMMMNKCYQVEHTGIYKMISRKCKILVYLVSLWMDLEQLMEAFMAKILYLRCKLESVVLNQMRQKEIFRFSRR